MLKHIGAQKFNFVFTQSNGFSAADFVFLNENVPTRRKFSDRLKLGVWTVVHLPFTFSFPFTWPMPPLFMIVVIRYFCDMILAGFSLLSMSASTDHPSCCIERLTSRFSRLIEWMCVQWRTQGGQGVQAFQSSRQNISIRLNCTKFPNLVTLFWGK